MLNGLFRTLFGTRNEKELKRYNKRVLAINALESTYEPMSDTALQNAFLALKDKVQAGESTLDDVLNDTFAITRESSRRILGMRHFDVQLVGGLVLHEGRIAEMKTGEGKTLVATLPVALNAMSGDSVHVVTVNDYLAKRDGLEMGKLYTFLGYTVGIITSDLQEDTRIAHYRSNIVYGTNNEYGFDYLRDNMKYSPDEKVQHAHTFAIVDEVDSILIDEARTPLIISGPTHKKLENYQRANEIALKLEQGEKIEVKGEQKEQLTGDFVVDEKNRIILPTDAGIQKAEALFGVENLYSLDHAILAHHLDQALKAHYLFHIDKDYVIRNNEVIIVDEFTGRLSEGRRFSDGLHQALEAKEGVEVKEESQTLADVTFQNYFRQYTKLSGMTGTAQTEAAEFSQIYSLDVVSIPTNVTVMREDRNDLIYKSEREKFDAVIQKVQELHRKGQPILIGTASIEKSELLSSVLKKEKIPHNVLNAKNHTKEAEIIKNAGMKGAITIATNMAGRGVDIKLGEGVVALGGLYIIGTERHESRRIDNQLRGRSGRQGDPGASQFYLSLEDSLLRIFGSDRIRNIMERLGIEEGEHIESGMVTRAVENAQKKVESMHFETRKHLLEYDDVSNEQRKTIYRFRDELLNPACDLTERLKENRHEVLDTLLKECGMIEGMESREFDYEALIAHVRDLFGLELSIAEIENDEFSMIKTILIEKITKHYETHMHDVTEDQRKEIERILYLQVLDTLWREHLYQMDILKTGIGLRGYNQKDPLVEYKKESYTLFLELVERIKREAIKALCTIQLRNEEEQKELEATQRLLRQMEMESTKGVSLIHEDGSLHEEPKKTSNQ
jgi:preprotein translocase subunit SecA